MALEFIMAGASAVEIGTAPSSIARVMDILDGIRGYMQRENILI
jgi:dihydroorotate dehydrogenase